MVCAYARPSVVFLRRINPKNAMLRTGIALLLLLLPAIALAQNPENTIAEDYILLSDNSKISGSVSLDDHQTKGLGIVYNHTTRYGLNEVISFTQNGLYYTKYATLQRIGDSVMPRPLLLARIAENNLNLYTVYKGRSIDPQKASIHYFSKEEGPIRKATYRNLLPALRDNPESLRLMKKSRKWRRARLGLLMLGTATLSYGLYRSILDSQEVQYFPAEPLPAKETRFNFTLNPIAPLGLAIGLSSIFPNRAKKANFRAAIQAY